MVGDEDFLASINLDAHEWRGVQELANALSDFEPLAKRANLGPTVQIGLLHWVWPRRVARQTRIVHAA